MSTISDHSVELPGTTAGELSVSFATLLADWALRLGDATALTCIDYRGSAEGRAVNLGWRELDDRVSAVAHHLGAVAEPGERAAVLASQSAGYVVAFLGAIRAGLVAVPLFTPGLPGHAGRLATTLVDCSPAVVLTTAADEDEVTAFLAGQPLDPTPVVAVDRVGPAPAGPHEWHRPHPDELAYLQYTSGSTRRPAGVMLTHRNVVNNARQACTAYGAESVTTSAISWLPLYHDMGLILGIGSPVTGGLASVIMDPIAFLEKPVRWLKALSGSPGAITAGPNFAYAYAASRVTEDEKAFLDLSRVISLINGSEPVLPSTISTFQEAFAECGLPDAAQRASYGLAEATVLVSVTDAGTPSRQVTFDRDRLAAGVAVAGAPCAASTTLVSCGRAAEQEIRIVDPATGAELPEGHVGEIRVSGPNVGLGYWNRPEESARTFGLGGSWLATGDLGVVVDGEMFMTGRIKDLVIVDGRNHYPQDVEQTVEAHPSVRPHSAAVFSTQHEGGERAVVVMELAKRSDVEPTVATGEVRATVAAEHGLRLHDVVFVAPGTVPRTSSGKISRALAAKFYLGGRFDEGRIA